MLIHASKTVSQHFKKRKMKIYKNIVEAIYFSRNLKILTGSVFTIEANSDNRIVSKFTFLGLVFFLIWLTGYFYCVCITFCEDQTILRSLYNTKLQHYGDVFERIVSIVYVIFAMWKVSFDFSRNPLHIQEILDIDMAFEKISVPIDHGRSARVTFVVTMSQIVICSAHLLTVCVTLNNLEANIPIEVMARVTLYDYIVAITTSHYCFYLILLTDRYNMINGLLRDIKERKAWEYTVLVRSKPCNVEKAEELQDKYVCEKIKACARIYNMLYSAHRTANSTFGLTLVLTFFFCLLFIILYLFYFMEATASGLFHDMRRYLYFLTYVFWQIAYAVGVIFLSIYFTEATVTEVSFKYKKS